MNFRDFLKLISKIEKAPLPGEMSQFKMVPPFRKALLKEQSKAINNAKKAAVMALFYPDTEHKTNLVLILRKIYKGVHSNQVGFPGGKLEKYDKTLIDAAIRETFEEIGLPKSDITVIKQLTEVYIPVSNFQVYPFIGVTSKTPQFIKQNDEVEAIIEVKLNHFLDDKNVGKNTVSTSYGADVEVSAFKLNNYVVWGATAMMLSEIKDLLKQVL